MQRLRALGGLFAMGAIVALTLVMVRSGPDTRSRPAAGSDGVASADGTPGASSGGVRTVVASEAGRDLYLATCASCHGPDGRGGSTGPSLTSSGPAAWDFYLRTGRMPLSAPGQPADKQGRMLSDAQIDALVAFGATIGTGPPIPQVVTDDAALQRGRDLFVNSCAACHGATAGGGSVGPGVFAPALTAADPVIIGEAILVGPGAMPQFAWDQQQLSDVAAYVQWLSVAPQPGGLSTGGLGPVPEGLVAVIIGLGLLVAVSRWIGSAVRRRP